MGLSALRNYCERLGLEMVPVEEAGDSFAYTLDELLEKARGKYPSGVVKEGIVVRTRNFSHNDNFQHKNVFQSH
jgi:hypothetical protein